MMIMINRIFRFTILFLMFLILTFVFNLKILEAVIGILIFIAILEWGKFYFDRYEDERYIKEKEKDDRGDRD